MTDFSINLVQANIDLELQPVPGTGTVPPIIDLDIINTPGDPGVYVGPTPPANTNLLWVDTSM